MSDWAFTRGVKLYVRRSVPRFVTNAPWGRWILLRCHRMVDVNTPPPRCTVADGTRLTCRPERKPPTLYCMETESQRFRSVLPIPAASGARYLPAGTTTPG